MATELTVQSERAFQKVGPDNKATKGDSRLLKGY